MSSELILWAIIEWTPDEVNGVRGYHKRIVLVREQKEDCMTILEAIQMSNIDFEDYTIEELQRGQQNISFESSSR